VKSEFWYVYILLCADKKPNIGFNDLLSLEKIYERLVVGGD